MGCDFIAMDDADSGEQMLQNEEILTQEKTAEARSAFGLFEKDGQVNRDDIGQVLRAIGVNPTEAELNEFKDPSIQGGGTVNFDELLQIYTYKKKQESNIHQELKAAFDVFVPKAQREKVDPKILVAFLTQYGDALTEEQVMEVVKETDVLNEGFVNLDQFISVMLS